jgi:hypothetical protein
MTAARASLANASRELRDQIEVFETLTAPAQRFGQLAVDLAALDARSPRRAPRTRRCSVPG